MGRNGISPTTVEALNDESKNIFSIFAQTILKVIKSLMIGNYVA